MMEKLIIIDGNSLINRAFYGVPMLSNSKGVLTNAVYGFFNMMLNLLKQEEPEYLAVAFDVSKKCSATKNMPIIKAPAKVCPRNWPGRCLY